MGGGVSGAAPGRGQTRQAPADGPVRRDQRWAQLKRGRRLRLRLGDGAGEMKEKEENENKREMK